MTVVTHYQNEYQRLQQSLPGENLAWLKSQRQAALERFAELGVPNRKHEDWKYTNLNYFAQQKFMQYKASMLRVVAPSLPPGVEVLSLQAALLKYPQLLSDHLQADVLPSGDVFSALNTALMQDGVCIIAHEQTHCEQPIVIHYDALPPNASHNIRNLVIAKPGAKLSVIEYFQGEEASDALYFRNAVTQVQLHSNAQLHHYKVIREAAQGYHIGHVYADCAADAHFYGHSFSFSGGMTRSDTTVSLNGKGAYASLNGLYLLGKKEHCDHHTQIYHCVPHATSEQMYKGIIAEQASAVFNGQVIVAKDAQKTKTQQHNKNIILSPTAQINTKPQLEIYADDVKCIHSSTVGQLAEEAIFYLQSRGINRQQALVLLTQAFAQEMVDKISLAELREDLDAQLWKKLQSIT